MQTQKWNCSSSSNILKVNNCFFKCLSCSFTKQCFESHLNVVQTEFKIKQSVTVKLKMFLQEDASSIVMQRQTFMVWSYFASWKSTWADLKVFDFKIKVQWSVLFWLASPERHIQFSLNRLQVAMKIIFRWKSLLVKMFKSQSNLVFMQNQR